MQIQAIAIQKGQSDKFEVHLLLFCRNSMLLPTKLVGWYVGMTWK